MIACRVTARLIGAFYVYATTYKSAFFEEEDETRQVCELFK